MHENLNKIRFFNTVLRQFAKLAIVLAIIAFLVLSQYFNGSHGYARLQAGGGLSIGHFIFFFLVGIVYPDYMYLAIGLGILFELLEYAMVRWLTPDARASVLKVIGGRFATSEGTDKSQLIVHHYDAQNLGFRCESGVYDKSAPHGNGFKSPTHWLDRLTFGGDYPTDHWWQPKVTDALLNILGFLAGSWLISHIK